MYAKENIRSHLDFITSKGPVKGGFIRDNNKEKQIKKKKKRYKSKHTEKKSKVSHLVGWNSQKSTSTNQCAYET